MTEPRTFYIWKTSNELEGDTTPNWKGTNYDTWYLHVKNDQTVTKTEFFFLNEIQEHIRKTFKLSPREFPRPEIITAAPINLSSIREISGLDLNQSINVTNLNYEGLIKKEVLFVKSYKDKDFAKGENLFIDISYKKIIEPDSIDFRRKRAFIGELRRTKLSEYQAEFPSLKFDAAIIDYFTYEVNPACNRSFDELFDDYEIEQEAFGYEAFLDAQHDI